MNLFRKLEMRRCRSLGCRCRLSFFYEDLWSSRNCLKSGKPRDLHPSRPCRELELELRHWISWLLSCASQLSTAEAKVGFGKKRRKNWKDPTNLQDFFQIEPYRDLWISSLLSGRGFRILARTFVEVARSRSSCTFPHPKGLMCFGLQNVSHRHKMLDVARPINESTQSIFFVLWKAVCVMLQCDAEVWHVSTSTEWSRPQAEILLHFSCRKYTKFFADLYNLCHV